MLSLLRVATSLGFLKAREPVPTCKVGWNGLPEDVFNIILREHLGSDIPSAKSLSSSCKSYATFSRSYIFRAIELAGPKAVKEFDIVLTRHPWVIDLVRTLRITDSEKRICLQGKGRNAALKPAGEALLSILCRQFTQLKTLELPILYGRHQWTSLLEQLKEAICAFLRRHQLEEVSVTTHYPLEILRACPALRRLEYRIYADTNPLTMAPARGTSSSLEQPFRHPGPVATLQELVIQDSSNATFAFIPHLIHPTSPVDLKELGSLTYYGDNAPVAHLQVILDHCVTSLSTLKVFANGNVGPEPYLCTSDLSRLSHLTLSMSSIRYDINSANWLYGTIGVRLLNDHLKQSAHRLKTVHIVVRTADLGDGTEALNACIRPLVSFGVKWERLKQYAGLTSDDLPLEYLRSIQVSAAIDKRSWDSISPGFHRTVEGMQVSDAIDWSVVDTIGDFTKDDLKRIMKMARMQIVQDKFYLWL